MCWLTTLSCFNQVQTTHDIYAGVKRMVPFCDGMTLKSDVSGRTIIIGLKYNPEYTWKRVYALRHKFIVLKKTTEKYHKIHKKCYNVFIRKYTVFLPDILQPSCCPYENWWWSCLRSKIRNEQSPFKTVLCGWCTSVKTKSF